MLLRLPQDVQRDHRELQLQLILGPALMAMQGWTTPSVEATWSRALQLCRKQEDNTGGLFSALRGLWECYEARGDLQMGRNLSDELAELANRVGDKGLTVVSDDVITDTSYWTGDLLSTVEHAERAIALYDVTEHHHLAFLMGGYDPAVACLNFSSVAKWMLGYPDKSIEKRHSALTLARKLSQPFSYVFALYFAAMASYLRRDELSARNAADEAVAFCVEYGFPFWLGICRALRGWALVELGEPKLGMEQIRQGISEYEATGARLERPFCFLLLADASRRNGQMQEAKEAVLQALTSALKMGHHTFESELHRIDGELLILADRFTDAEAAFRRARHVARSQSARSWELRSATSLARLLLKQILSS